VFNGGSSHDLKGESHNWWRSWANFLVRFYIYFFFSLSLLLLDFFSQIITYIMTTNNQQPFTQESTLLNCFDSYSTSDNLFLNSTKNQGIISDINLLDPNRRKALIPTPNRPTLTSSIIVTSKSENTVDNCKKNIEDEPNSISNNPDTMDKIDEINEQLDDPYELTQSNITHDFDTFIIEQFVPFSGLQDVEEWLDETEIKFSRFKISRQQRFEAISLLVEKEAKRTYIKVRKEIHSYDDFYEFLLSNFESNHNTKCQLKRSLYTNNGTVEQDISCLNPPSNRQGKSNYSIATVDLTQKTLPLHTTTIIDLGTTNILGETQPTKSTNNISCSSTYLPDETISDLRKAVVGDLIKNPRIFKGEKDDVKKWVEDIEHRLDVAHIPDNNRLNLISYLLRGDALEWYKANKDKFISWTKFLIELKRAFTSSFHEELAFKKLEAYTQGENQSIRNFFNGVLKLCNEADSTMSVCQRLVIFK
jgi:hypothetical protein